MAARSPRREVHKFGGASLADAAAIRGATELIVSRKGPQVVVVSAIAGITDLLLGLIRAAELGDHAALETGSREFRSRHHRIARELLPARHV
ncbi:MAG TPA: hypothetical protein PLL69_11190, partial [Gemmatimonadales bacterium]|nr:hypothetical protein [Gemmatimonadales bacterium]